jgi:hypothetical protein
MGKRHSLRPVCAQPGRHSLKPTLKGYFYTNLVGTLTKRILPLPILQPQLLIANTNESNHILFGGGDLPRPDSFD